MLMQVAFFVSLSHGQSGFYVQGNCWNMEMSFCRYVSKWVGHFCCFFFLHLSYLSCIERFNKFFSDVTLLSPLKFL